MTNKISFSTPRPHGLFNKAIGSMGCGWRSGTGFVRLYGQNVQVIEKKNAIHIAGLMGLVCCIDIDIMS